MTNQNPMAGQKQRSKIKMTDEEIAAFLDRSRTCTFSTIGPTGHPHLVAMWYAWVDGKIWVETKAKGQKVKNLQRNPNLSVMVEAGDTYDQLRGVCLEGTGVIVDDPDDLWAVGVNVFERYQGPYSEDMRPIVEMMLNKRVAIRLDVECTRSWDHRKLALGPMPLSGTTALPAASG